MKEQIKELSRRFDSFYIYEERTILTHIRQLKENFPSAAFLYSMKCNPHPGVLKSVFSQGFGADAASLGEVMLAETAGLSKEQIYYSAPGKTSSDIEGALDRAVLIADSAGEVERIREAARRKNTVAKIGIRINPDFTLQGSGGVASKFGIDETRAEELVRKETDGPVKIVGIHIHVKSQELDAEALGTYYKKIIRLAERFQTLCGGLEFVNMGSGMGVPYAADDRELDVRALGRTVEEALGSFRVRYPGTKIFLETGRYAVCKAGFYVTKVIDRKDSYGKTFLILKNTLNGFIRPSLERLILHYAASENPSGMEPLFTCRNAFGFFPLKEAETMERVTLVGNLCTAADVAAEDLLLPRLEPGDCVVMTNAGSYAAVLSPMQFSSQERPAELFLTSGGELRDERGNRIENGKE